MNRKLQQYVAAKFEENGFIKYGNKIRFASDSKGIRKVACTVIQRLVKNDPEGFGNDLRNICTKGETSYDS